MEVLASTLRYLFDAFYYMFVVISWNLRQIWNRLENSPQDNIDETQQIAQNTKQLSPLMRTTRSASARRFGPEYSKPLQFRYSYRKPGPLHLSKDFFGSYPPDLDAHWDPNRPFFVSYYDHNYIRDDLTLSPL